MMSDVQRGARKDLPPQDPNLIRYSVGGLSLQLRTDAQVFLPRLTTKIIADCLTIQPGIDVLDLGCGSGPMGIFAAMKGARSVTCVDIMPEACSLARYNATLNGVSEKVQVVESDLLESVNGRQFDVIVDDVSGIADEVARVSSWYPEPIPTGGYDGAVQVLRMLETVMDHLRLGGKLFLPISSLSSLPRIVNKAREQFGSHLELLVDRMIPFPPELYAHREPLERLREEGVIDFTQRNSRCLWNLKVFVGTRT